MWWKKNLVVGKAFFPMAAMACRKLSLPFTKTWVGTGPRALPSPNRDTSSLLLDVGALCRNSLAGMSACTDMPRTKPHLVSQFRDCSRRVTKRPEASSSPAERPWYAWNLSRMKPAVFWNNVSQDDVFWIGTPVIIADWCIPFWCRCHTTGHLGGWEPPLVKHFARTLARPCSSEWRHVQVQHLVNADANDDANRLLKTI